MRSTRPTLSAGGFGSAALEAAAAAGMETNRILAAGVSDRFVEHASRAEQLRVERLDARGLAERVEDALAGE